MVEVPKDDLRQRQRWQCVGFLFETLCQQAIAAGRLEQMSGIAAVARHTAGNPQFFKRHVATVVAKNDGKRGGSTFHRFKLKHGRCYHAVRLLRPCKQRRWVVAAEALAQHGN